MFSGTFKDVFTNIIAIIMVIGGAVNAYLQSLNGGDINWLQLLLVIGGAIVAYFTGKNGNGTAKTA